ncbi:MAG: tetratricopeptide repeat protein [Pirellulaceae bacterium]
MFQSSCRFLGCAAILLSGLVLPVGAADSAPDEPQAQLDARIAELIDGLGADEFSARERAQRELERLGLEAFDALYQAQRHQDIEVAMRARHLVQRLRVNWSLETDPQPVKVILRNYGDQSDPERRNRMERLAGLDTPEAISALCRLVRFETSEVLSKRAALLILEPLPADDVEQRKSLAVSIRRDVGLSRRPGADWLRAYAATLDEQDDAIARWERLVRSEQEGLSHAPDNKFNRDVVRDLMRWHADLLRHLDRDAEAIAAMRNTLDLLDGTREQLLDAVDWLMQREAWQVVDDVAERYTAQFEENPLLLYRLAECRQQQGRIEQADETADRALEINADAPDAHMVVALSLQDRGLFKWARREYERVLEIGPVGSVNDLGARFLLSEMLHDLDDDKPAAEVLRKAVEAMDADPNVMQIVEDRFLREPGSVRSRMHFFDARHSLKAGDAKKHFEHLREGIKEDPTDADLLIAMYRAPDAEPEWRKMTLDKIDAAVGHFRTQIRDYEQEVAQAPSESIRAGAARRLAMTNNQLAWLVANTQGDFDEAVRCSQASLELFPDSGGYLDTLGRCHYARGELEKAVEHQRRAVEHEPFSGQIRRQLKMFEAALAEQNAAQKKNGAP